MKLMSFPLIRSDLATLRYLLPPPALALWWQRKRRVTATRHLDNRLLRDIGLDPRERVGRPEAISMIAMTAWR